ncbi:hypothetical protein Dsin_025389 [Dipteronia sinensis]|uniref:Uncharacterized protein n=1 Tax=Dipteronia sinensis TaxID=43782 RepID=A0AAD9ZW14_9ROSI|nr:hypothetical protein Dsin_025389 [Dipteronia sinensis]
MLKMRNLRASLETPQADWYDAKITHHNHMESPQVIDEALDGVLENTATKRDMYNQSCFGHFQHMQVEFCLITGLKFGAILNTELYEDVPNGIHHKYFSGRDMVTFAEIEARIEQERKKGLQSLYGSCALLITWRCSMRSCGVRMCTNTPFSGSKSDLSPFSEHVGKLRESNIDIGTPTGSRSLASEQQGTDVAAPTTVPDTATRHIRVKFVLGTQTVGLDARGGTASHTDRRSPEREVVTDHWEHRFAKVVSAVNALR